MPNQRFGVCHQANAPSAVVISAIVACILAPRLYDGFHSVRAARSSSTCRATWLKMVSVGQESSVALKGGGTSGSVV